MTTSPSPAAQAEGPATDRAPSRLSARGLTLAYDDHTVVDGLDADIVEGTITCVIGPNGCGKSTMLRALGRLMRPKSGVVELDGRDIHRVPTREVAQVLGVLPQQPVAPDGLTVADLVARGRHPSQRWYRQWSGDDHQAVSRALAQTGLLELADTPIQELSGGQRQRAWISMVLAQGTDLLLLDEPTTFLDLVHQVDVLDLVQELHRQGGRTIVMVLHDLNLAARYADTVITMREGRVVASGSPAEVLTPELLRKAFDLEAVVTEDPVTGGPLIVPVGRSTGAV
ncbi:iron-enterobactin transporter ATP-binding protein [Nocardiopsis terrae]|uniref:Iron complex transport system ATP-binding protein n=1 Tax=Nocardiopsis terrae TaxID=372655 RepID=A0ABR9HFZ7_9ACTN|nr:ABC transporter ATP-binding protein [Nocardiopsis terrae]MBE1457956.1 iron complex transport system ATP-binding protein [Nocardiopsis terrae]GHC83327.1 iron-enterobactin transporter ATP-binding protein [Nocardiopsis terrae]